MRDQVADIWRREGFGGILASGIAFAYRRGVRSWLPASDPVRYAGIPIGLQRKVGDGLVPSLWTPPGYEDLPDYEAALVRGLRKHIRSGDRVTVVGGGVGVTATIAALEAGSDGSVVCYEAAAEGVEKVLRTAEANAVKERLTVHHAVVGRPISVYGRGPQSRVVAPEEIAACDVLELDCEGAELDILDEMVIRPRVILVETHGVYGAPTSRIDRMLRDLGYETEPLGPAEPRVADECRQKDIHVLAAVRIAR